MPRSPTEPSTLFSLRLTLLGAFRLERDGQPLALYSRKVESLFAYLVLHPKAHSREKLAGMFWGDSPDEQARLSLRVGLSDLRKKLGDAVLLADRETVQINPQAAVTVDVAEVFDFRLPLAEVERLQAQIANYRGDLLADFYDEWIDPLRDEYRERYLAALFALIERARAQGGYAQVVELGRRLLATDRANETAHQHVMFALAAQGERTAALEQYAACERALRAELDVAPAPETRALFQSIKQKSDTASAAARLTNLPRPLTSFVGRETELKEMMALLAGARLLTLTGVGGAGKTRLATEAGRALLSAYRAGVWWADLSSLAEAALVPGAVAQALGVQERPNQPITETLVEFLRAKSLLLVVDNCEHLIAACAAMIETLLTECEHLCVLATSREALGIAGEQVYPVPSLATPTVGPPAVGSPPVGATLAVAPAVAPPVAPAVAPPVAPAVAPPVAPAVAPPVAPTELLQFAAVRLFVERARAQLPGFQLTSQNTAAVVRICQRLDGIPLALELAAARVSGLSVEEIAQRLDDRFRLLTTGSRTALPRQQTLRALIDWSYDLLADAERALFRRLAVFAGGWTLEAAEAVCADQSPSPPSPTEIGDGGVGRDDILDLQTRLIAKSLVIAETSAGAMRDRMLETIRDYARAKSAAQEIEQTSARHYDYFVALAERAEPELRGKFLIAWHKRLETDHDNLRAALRWALSQPDANLALRLSGALHEFWMFRNHAAEGQSWYEMALARRDEPCQPLYLAKAYSGAGSMAWMQGNPAQAHQLHTQALHYFEQANDKNGMASSLHNLGTQRWHQGDWEDAEDLATRALRMANEAGDDWLKANILNGLGVIWGARGNDGQALLYYADAVTLARKTGDPLALMFGLHNLGCVAGRQGDFQRAGELLEESSRLAQKIEYSYLIVGNLAERGLLCIRQGDYAAAVPLCRRAAQLAVESMYKELLLRAIEWLAAACGYQHHFERAARLWGAAAAMREETRTGPGRSDLVIYETAVDYVRAHIGEERLAALLAQGRGMTLEQTLAYALE